MSLRHTTFALAALALVAAPAGAAIQLVTVNTTGLTAGDTYYAEFTLTDGSGTGDGNSTAAISDLTFVNGSLGAVLPPATGNVSGGLGPADTLTLQDGPAASGPTADFAQAFTVSSPASSFSYALDLAATSVDTPTPDNFTMQILDSTQTALATTGPTGIEFVTADYTTTSPAATGYQSTDPGISPPVTATVTSEVAATPEPSQAGMLALMTLGLGGLLWRARRRAA